jgi:hypothetical protein
MGFPACLIRRHNHLRALAALGLSLEKPVFPAILHCPRCQQNTLQIFDDILTDGLWLNCSACAAHGDIITFGADLWNISLPDTLTKFSDLSVISENDANRVAGDYARAIAKQSVAENFWQEAAAQIWNHGDDLLASRLRDLGLRSEIAGCYGLVGVAHHDQIAKLCQAAGRAKPARSREDGAAIVLPFYTLPGQLVGFSIWQYTEENEPKQTFIGLSGYRRKKQEAGYFLLDKVLGPAPAMFKGTQFVSDDALWVLKLQCDYVSRHGQSLPIAASYSGPEAESYGATWGALPTGSRIFHGAVAEPELISRACNARGYVAVVPPDNRATKPYGNAIDSYILGRLYSMRVNAKTWQQALAAATTVGSELNAQAFMQRLTIPPDKLGLFLDKHSEHFSADFKTRVLTGVKMALAAPTRTHKRRIVIERDTGWWSQVGQQIANVRVVIAKVIQADTGDKMYCGSIYMDDQEYTFMDSARRIERMGLLAYAAAVMAPHGKLVIFDRSWNKSSHMIAMQLRPPKLASISTRSGWDENTNTFRFAKYELTHAGDVQPASAWATKKTAKIFPEPAPIAPLPLRGLLTPAHENSFIWAFAASVLGNLVAPIMRKDYFATAIAAKNFDTAQRLAEVFGCANEQTAVLQRRNSYKFLNNITNNATWPVLGSSAFNDEVLCPHVPKYFNRPLLLRTTRTTAVTSVGYGWCAIKDAPTYLKYDLDPLRYVLPAYIQRALKARMHMFGDSDNMHQTVLRDLHDWMTETYGVSFNLQHAENLMAYPASAHVELLRELNLAVSAGKIGVLPVPRQGKQPGDYILRKKDHWWLNRRAVDRYFYSARSITPNWLAIIDLLQKDNVYAGEEVIHNMTGVLIAADWCDQFLCLSGESLEKETG